MKLLIQIVSVIVLWLLAVGWAFMRHGSEFTFQDVESAALAFIIGIVMFGLVDRYYEE